MKHFIALKVSCKTNPDIIGIWNEDDIKDEMLEILGICPEGNEWMEYVMNHLDIPQDVINTVMDDNVLKLSVIIGNDVVDFSKQ